ncbi:MAG TPA: hypothetical protein PK801_06185 [Aggregatilineales bacterium]|jgi:hypothetical protein|nr:hypothetical protein [Chloroflexota bacterium]HOA24996.1 hypothetical protein [Aggregatilineales bacterium]HPV08523.1 hypothetical protein [Aggregatilineales bacterium]HQA67890.1 hypothetical protein [Aggregatilineales bacterium]
MSNIDASCYITISALTNGCCTLTAAAEAGRQNKKRDLSAQDDDLAVVPPEFGKPVEPEPFRRRHALIIAVTGVPGSAFPQSDVSGVELSPDAERLAPTGVSLAACELMGSV